MLQRFIFAAGLFFAVSASANDLPLQTAVLTRDGATLTLGDLDAYVAEAPPELRAGLLASGRRTEQILRQLLAVKNLANEAEALGLTNDPIVRSREQLLLARFRAQLRTEQLQQAARIDAVALAKERYTLNPDRYSRAETITVRHLLVDTKQRDDAGALRIAEEYLARVRNGESLKQLATAYSDDPGSKELGGELTPATREQFDPAFADAAFGLVEPGQIVGPVRSNFGYHLIELIERQPAGPRDFAEVKDQIVAEIEAEHRQRVADQHLDQINGKPITKNEDALSVLADRYRERYGSASGEAPVSDARIDNRTAPTRGTDDETR